MPNNADLIELMESELDMLILKAKRAGLPYHRILYCLIHRADSMLIQCSAEAWLAEKP